ncbi:hypothetical protein [Virgibacillus alimentarius]|uniref:Uncharacterized protein YukE n=1 Tax=Virgibacillus alimentarius TaxID=698769 RepID=A0ABS4S9P6_9BACI|nr:MULTISPECIES: hypothetical protein [Virgibacillus]MBP2257720.1 uncharacterized protein YukE [Virgibacillus alimentarius]HLR69286.1 hypothetical protein [Virgibacillus sp.]
MTEETRKNRWKNWNFWFKVGGGIIVAVLLYVIGHKFASIELEEEAMKYEDVKKRVEEKHDQLEETQKKLDNIKNELRENNQEYEETQEVIANRNSIQDEVDKLAGQVTEKKGEVKELKKEIKDKNKELQSVTGEIKEAKGKPITLSAGKFVVGEDLPANRYKVTPNGNGNFFVNDGVDVNVILGNDGDFYESEYVFEAFEGDKIELTSSATFTPVE